MKTCSECNMSGIPDDARLCPECGNMLNICPSSMPSEVDYRDEFLGQSDWRMTFHYMIDGEYRRFPGKILDEKYSPNKTFVINCLEDGYMRDMTLFHSNGNVALYVKFGLYLMNCFDNVEQAEFYSETGQSITQDNFFALYEGLWDSFASKMEQIKTTDSGSESNEREKHMKTCPRCNMTGIPDDAKFCPKCGKALTRKEKTQKVDKEPSPSIIEESVIPVKSKRKHKPWYVYFILYMIGSMGLFCIYNLFQTKPLSWGVGFIFTFALSIFLTWQSCTDE